jgi:glycosyltransferase involved in cell wall biosynthesis
MITIITPTYKRHQYLKNAIDSVLAQTYADFEQIVVDDNPADSEERKLTEEVMKQVTDPRVRYVQNEKNLGGAAARNVGIFMAQGEYIAFLDDDDMYLPDRLEIQYKKMVENGWDVSVMDGATYNYVTGEKVAERHQKLYNGMTKNELIRSHLLYHISGTNTFMFKASFLKAIGGFMDVPSCQEYMLMQKALDNNPKFGYIPEIHIKNFMHPGEQLSTGPKKLKGQMTLYESKKQHFDLLTASERRQVTCRHHGVLFFVYYKMHQYGKAFIEAVKCFCSSPTNAFKWFMEYRKKINA